MTIRHLSIVIAALLAAYGAANAQGFPAPLPGQSSAASPFPPVNGSAPAASMGAPSAFPSAGAPPIGGMGPSTPPPQQQAGPPGGDDCMKAFVPLRDEAQKRGTAIKAASDRRAPPEEACKLIGLYAQAELKMIKYVDGHAQKCGIPPQVSDQLRGGHKNTETMLKKVCTVAQQAAQRAPAGPSLSDVLGSSAALPEATATKRGGSTFDTLSGNVLAR